MGIGPMLEAGAKNMIRSMLRAVFHWRTIIVLGALVLGYLAIRFGQVIPAKAPSEDARVVVGAVGTLAAVFGFIVWLMGASAALMMPGKIQLDQAEEGSIAFGLFAVLVGAGLLFGVIEQSVSMETVGYSPYAIVPAAALLVWMLSAYINIQVYLAERPSASVHSIKRTA